MPARWRLLADGARSAAWNMSLDEALLEHASASLPTLRLYRWRGPCASLGFRQKTPSWLPRAKALGVDPVRRCSGGGTVLHVGDLTYAVTLPLGGSARLEEVPGDLDGSYAWIRERLLDGLRRAGLRAAPSRAREGASRSAVCFEAPTGNEIDLGAAKLVGSAQRRTRWALLQHGSIRLGDDAGWYRLLLASDPPAPRFEAGVDADRVAAGIVAAFEAMLGTPVASCRPDPHELRRAEWRESRRRSARLSLPALRERPASADTLP